MTSLEERVALVTGASQGLGAVIAVHLARAGVRVFVNFKDSAAGAQRVVDAIHHAGGKAWPVQADVGDESQVDQLARDVESNAGRVDVLVNNAAINRDGVSWRLSKADWDDVRRTNLDGPFLCTRRFLPGMRERGWGRIINVTSVVGECGIPGTSAYAATKAGLIGFTRAVASEVLARGVTVNALALGYFDAGLMHKVSPKAREAILERIPMGRLGRPDEAAAAVVFLASDSAAYITGQVISMNGGFRT